MTHLSETSRPLSVREVAVGRPSDLFEAAQHFNDVCAIRLPGYASPSQRHLRLHNVGNIVATAASRLGSRATLVTLGEPLDLVEVQAVLSRLKIGQYQHWIAIKMQAVEAAPEANWLPANHFGALVHTLYRGALRHSNTRIQYSYCPACDKTTKDYGGKKHTYHHYGTLISDVWRDIACDLDGDLSPVIERLADLFGIAPYKELLVCDLHDMELSRSVIGGAAHKPANASLPFEHQGSTLIKGDCLEELAKIPDNSVDFIFADPPYNLQKQYRDYSDDLDISEYFKWCDSWLQELGRVLRPQRSLAILNIPLWAIRHFLQLETDLQFQNWIAWDALAFPVRRIMPAHYAILCFSKGKSRPLPGLIGTSGQATNLSAPLAFDPLNPMADGYCLRSDCVKRRQAEGIGDRGMMTDLWSDIHRLKHNSRRVDHPTQLPPHLMYRLISAFTEPGEMVLDCFNGAGTTTLAAHQLGRRYIGIEQSPKYFNMAVTRHDELEAGLDPFRKTDTVPEAKNSRVRRVGKTRYEVPKKTLQLEVRRVSQELGHIPSREELRVHGKYPIEYYDQYFVSWGEVTAAARTTGMSERKEEHISEGG